MDSLAALADSTRRQIVELLSSGERSSGDIAGQFSISAPAISQHLKVLREAKLVRVRIEAQRRLYTLDPQGFSELDAWLHHIRRFWQTRLDLLERDLRRPEPSRKEPAKGRRR